jgi:hypothetical protein
VSKTTKTLDRILRGNSDANIRFGDLCALLKHLDFAQRVRGDHYIFSREGVAEILNLQPRGDKAKAYQVKQVRSVIISYNLAGEPVAEPPEAEQSAARDASQTTSENEDEG